MTRNPKLRANSGFSLLEVLIAVVILATGLLALAALQGSLARNSADAKVRSRIVSLLSAEMDNERSTAYDAVASLGAPISANSPDCTDLSVLNAVEVAACDAGLSNLTLNRTVTQYGANVGGTAFDAGAPAGSNKAEFKVITVTATWTDATGQTRSSSMRSTLSALALQVNNPLVDNDSDNEFPAGPVVRQSSPVTAGMIPIALGNGDSTAASNPTPELVGKNQNQTLVGTRFNVLTYTPTDNNLAIIQQRIETEVIKCTCQYGAGGSNLGEIYRTAQWPAVWTGSRYELYVPDDNKAAPGQQWSAGPKSGVTQSALCQECCRDHHDDYTNTTDPRFDPESTATSYVKYNDNSGTLTTVTPGGSSTYVDACRVLRVDGLWRTASDMYARQFGLLETESVSGVQAKTGLPTTNATSRYTTYVKDFLQQYDGTDALPPSNAQSLFDDTTRQLNLPAEVAIDTPSNSDRRYLHGRGLYVDHLEKQAREALAKSLADRREEDQCLEGGSDLADCVLPFLPFTTINLTEIAKWRGTDTTVLNVNNDGALATDPNQPFGGRTLGKKVGIADTEAKVRHSNSGVAASTVILGAVDDKGDATTLTDKQTFNVGGSNSATGDDFYVNINGGPANYVLWYIFSGDTNECQGSVHLRQCSTNTTLPLPGSIRLESYSGEEMVTTAISSISGFQCYDSKGALRAVEDTTVLRPVFHNYQISSISNGGSVVTVNNDGLTTETTTISFPSITTSMDALNPIQITLADQTSPVPATFSSCLADKVQSNYYIKSVTWTKPWVVTP